MMAFHSRLLAYTVHDDDGDALQSLLLTIFAMLSMLCSMELVVLYLATGVGVGAGADPVTCY